VSQQSASTCEAWAGGHFDQLGHCQPTKSCQLKSRLKSVSAWFCHTQITVAHVSFAYIFINYASILGQHYIHCCPTCRRRVLCIWNRSNLPCGSSRPLLASRSRYAYFYIHTLICSISTNMRLNKIIHITIFIFILSAYILFNQIELTTIIHIVMVNNLYAIVLCMFFKSYFDI
jgi:hypothetical protein